VAFVMAIVGVVGFALIVSPQAALSLIAADLYETFSSYSLTVIPLFVLMGQIAFHTGISRRLFNAAYHWLGPLPGGLAMATVGACTAFGAICGSGPATAATMAYVALPEMKRYKYDPKLSSGTVAAGGSLAMLIPPSVVLIVFGIMTQQSIGKLFIAGIMPGLLIAAMFCVTIYVWCKLQPNLGPTAPRLPWRDRFKSLLGVSETLILFLAVIGAGGTILIGLVQRKLTWKAFIRSLHETVRTSCMVMIIIAGAVIFGHFLAVTRIPFVIATELSQIALPPWVIISMIIIFYLVAGCFVDALALVLLTVPIFYPVIEQLGYSLIWFGVVIVVVTQMGVISPPVCVNAYVVAGIERDIPLQTVFKGVVPFLVCLIVAAVILIAFPSISLWLPSLIK
jgi:tripartite ATP-independent transporter DctM subunit